MDFFYFNKLSELHNNFNILFCKTDYLKDEFKYIESIDNDVVLITGNSDYSITDNEINLAPKNIKKWFAQNALSNDEKIIPIPLGIENKIPSLRFGHGIGYYDRVNIKESLLSENIFRIPENFIYANFNVNTNYSERIKYKQLSLEIDFIDWDEPNLPLNDFFKKILDYKMILCPIGNGIDTHRLWEVIYSNRIPIIVKAGDYKIYELYDKLPIIILDDKEQLRNKDFLENKYEEIKNKNWDKNIITTSYWVDLIKSYGCAK